MDVFGLMLIGAAVLSLLPLLFVLYALVVDIREGQQPSVWDRLCTEQHQRALARAALGGGRFFQEASRATTKMYFQVQTLSSAVLKSEDHPRRLSEMVLERNPTAAWHSVTNTDEHTEITFCLFNRQGEQYLLTHRLWTN